jgi:hypothetical protein
MGILRDDYYSALRSLVRAQDLARARDLIQGQNAIENSSIFGAVQASADSDLVSILPFGRNIMGTCELSTLALRRSRPATVMGSSARCWFPWDQLELG